MRCTTRTEQWESRGGAAREVYRATGQPIAETAKQRSKGSLNRRPKTTPPLTRLRWGSVYCELCRETITAGQQVAWWRTRQHDRRTRPAAYCQTCHHANARAGRPLR
jgi:hypothetical protein